MDTEFLILGIGNLLRSDDGVGIHAVRALALRPSAGAEVVDAGTDFLSALPFLEQARRVLILDAVQAGGEPGTMVQLSPDEIVPRPGGGPAHTTSILEARRLLGPDAPWPQLTVLGIEPSSLEYGMTLSVPVAKALPRMVAKVRALLFSWQTPQSLNATPQVAP
jgi:hydrogenase maturation protease